MSKEDVKEIEKERDEDKKEMLHSVYANNKGYGSEAALGKIIKAMSVVDRTYFVPSELRAIPYGDIPLPIGHDQTISQPTTVARMLLLSRVKRGMRVLEVGSGSGWNASLLAFLAHPGEVVSCERIKPLSDFAKRNFREMKKGTKEKSAKSLNVDFMKGSVFSFPRLRRKRFDLLIVTAAAPSELINELKRFNFKRLVFPSEEGSLEVWARRGKKLILEKKEEGYAFVPLKK